MRTYCVTLVVAVLLCGTQTVQAQPAAIDVNRAKAAYSRSLDHPVSGT